MHCTDEQVDILYCRCKRCKRLVWLVINVKEENKPVENIYFSIEIVYWECDIICHNECFYCLTC